MSSIEAYVESRVQNGPFAIEDDKAGETMPVILVSVHQPIHRLKGDGQYFACTDFRRAGTQDQFYDVDFWMNQKDGRLFVTNVRVPKNSLTANGSRRRGTILIATHLTSWPDVASTQKNRRGSRFGEVNPRPLGIHAGRRAPKIGKSELMISNLLQAYASHGSK